MIYTTIDEAFARVERLIRSGFWPGVLACDGGWRLTYDPEVYA